MGEVVSIVLKILVRFAFILAGITAFVMLLNMAFSLVFITLNDNILTDLFKLVQIWLPFNLSTILAWLVTSASLYVFYRLTVASIGFINRLVGRG